MRLRERIVLNPLGELLMIFRVFAVPVFLIMSFELVSELFFSRDMGRLKKRVIRLLIPHIGWPIIYFTVTLMIGQVTLMDLFWQLTTGHSSVLNTAMWYQVVLVFLTVVIGVLFYLLKDTK